MPKPKTITFALEIGCEELPPGDLPLAEEQLPCLAGGMLSELRLSCKKISVYTTPRRIILIISGLPPAQKALQQEVVGPPMRAAYAEDGKPTKSALGFAKSQGVELSACYPKRTEKGDYLACKRILPAKTAAQALAEALPSCISRLSFPKTMRWNDSGVLFPRPVRWLLALADDKVVPLEFAGRRADRYSYGHRVLAKGKRVAVPNAGRLIALLKANGVLAEGERRVSLMRAQAKRLLLQAGGKIEGYDWLFGEVADTLEMPTALLGAFDQRHLLLPHEVIVSALVGYLRFFPIVSPEGKLLPHFIAYHNGRKEASAAILRGYQQEITARLNDASFFYEEDKKRGIDAIAGDLRDILFIEDLGTVAEKSERMGDLANQLNQILGLQLPDKDVGDAVRLAKADLASRMVQEKEFTSLQGVMGRYYAHHAGYPPEVALAIAEHYMPRVSGGELPTAPLGRLVAVSDRLDTLVGCFAHDILPSGSVDPFGLRRAGLGLLAILLDCRDEGSALPGAEPWHLSLPQAIKLALGILGERLPAGAEAGKIEGTLLAFLAQRLRGILAEHGIRYDLAEAAVGETLSDASEASKRAQGLQALSALPDFDGVAVAFKRVINIVRQGKERGLEWGRLDEGGLTEPAERELYGQFSEKRGEIEGAVRAGDYLSAFKVLATLRPAVDKFFDDVLVMDEDAEKRSNRLALMEEIGQFFLSLADFTRVVVEGE
jgi:glycyl-tRNA synthetase beta chain